MRDKPFTGYLVNEDGQVIEFEGTPFLYDLVLTSSRQKKAITLFQLFTKIRRLAVKWGVV